MLRPIRHWVRAQLALVLPRRDAADAGGAGRLPVVQLAARARARDQRRRGLTRAARRRTTRSIAGRRASTPPGGRWPAPASDHTGSFSSPRQRQRPLLLRARGVRVAFLAYTQMTNGIPLPHPWSVNLARAGRILRDARRARRAGARVVIVNLHWGTEFRHAPDAFQLALARRLARSRAITAVVGQHVHVVQPIRRVGRLWVVFGEGNLLSNQTAACCPAASQDGMLVRLHLRVGPRRATSSGSPTRRLGCATPTTRSSTPPAPARLVAPHGGGGRPLPPGQADALALTRRWRSRGHCAAHGAWWGARSLIVHDWRHQCRSPSLGSESWDPRDHPARRAHLVFPSQGLSTARARGRGLAPRFAMARLTASPRDGGRDPWRLVTAGGDEARRPGLSAVQRDVSHRLGGAGWRHRDDHGERLQLVDLPRRACGRA